MAHLWTSVERHFLDKSGRHDRYVGEQVAVVEVLNVYELGSLVALRFLEWVTANPRGVIALPTGRTPEYFIKTMERFRTQWGQPALVAEMTAAGFQPGPTFPDTSGLTFVMLDEFFPMSSAHRNSFCNYVSTFYLPALNIPADQVLDFDLIRRGVLTDAEMAVFNGHNVDLTLLQREPVDAGEAERKAALVKVQAYCDDFEARVRALGGIGFFLGGIGPDGHIAFNQEGSSHDAPTRLVNFNYPTAAAAAGDLGGIEIARGKAAMTIGLATICFKPDVVAIIMAAGEGKAKVVRAALEEPADASRPASCLHKMPHSRFYLTHGAASALSARKGQDVSSIRQDVCLYWALQHLTGENGVATAHLADPPKDFLIAERLIHSLSLKLGVPVHQLTGTDDIRAVLPEAVHVPEWFLSPLNFRVLVSCAARRLREKIEAGLVSVSCMGQSILHTAPHHDDIMLSYHGAMHEMLGRQPATQPGGQNIFGGNSTPASGSSSMGMRRNRSAEHLHRRGHQGFFEARLGETYNGNVNHFAYLTSGFHSVNDSVLLRLAKAVSEPDNTFDVLQSIVLTGELSRDYDDLMLKFHEAFRTKNYDRMNELEYVIFVRKVAEVFAIVVTQSYGALISQLRARVENLLTSYLAAHRPGDAIPKEMQLLKGCMRETEVDRVWALSNMPMNRIHHMRSKFYTDDFFCPMPSLEDDAMPFANLLRARQPNLITVAFDPEGTGPDTHYKVLQVVAAGLRLSLQRGELDNPNPMIWGYRNVWFVFTPSEATLMIPVSEEDLELMHQTFMCCFTTQKEASFPSPHYDGPFSSWARHLQVLQRRELSGLLGEDYFATHADRRVREAAGFIFLKAMRAEHFLREVEELKSKFEIVQQ